MMNTFFKKLSFCFLFMATTFSAVAQDIPTKNDKEHNSIFLGLGAGLDYGGIGAKIEYLPVKNIGIFAGLGYNLKDAGWNIGASYKIKASERVSINPMVFYGYNGVLKVDGASEYDMVSHGVSFGVNVDINVGDNGNKVSLGLYVPIRSKKFMDNYDAVKDDPYVKIENDLIPIAIGIGYNWRLN